MPVCFIDCPTGNERTDGVSYTNPGEADVVVDVVSALLCDAAGELRPGDIGVVTPYSAQVRHLRRDLTRAGLLKDGKVPPPPAGGGRGGGGGDARGVGDAFRRPRIDPSAVLEVSSVDGFQGREKEVIVFSAVRSNTNGKVGFLDDWRRVNVMLTRAKRGLIVVGSRETLVNERETWRRWLTWANANGCILGSNGPQGNYQPHYIRGTYL
jgi:superfamily I DNA and/or RNA helicase